MFFFKFYLGLDVGVCFFFFFFQFSDVATGDESPKHRFFSTTFVGFSTKKHRTFFLL